MLQDDGADGVRVERPSKAWENPERVDQPNTGRFRESTHLAERHDPSGATYFW